MTTTGPGATRRHTARTRLNRSFLVSNLASGALWRILLAVPWQAWSLLAGGAAYVVVGSLFLATVYAREPLTSKQQALAWVTPWIVAISLWTYLIAPISGGESGSDPFQSLWFGLLIATPCFLGWQGVAFLARHFMTRTPELEQPIAT